jgi:hypothetical protein
MKNEKTSARAEKVAARLVTVRYEEIVALACDYLSFLHSDRKLARDKRHVAINTFAADIRLVAASCLPQTKDKPKRARK